MTRVPAALLLVVLASTLVGCAQPTALETLAPTPTPTLEASTEPDGSISRPYDYGVLAPSDEGSMWDVTLTDPVMDASAIVAQGNEFNQPAPVGSQYIVVTITAHTREDISAENLGQPVSPWASLGAAFVGNDGHIYTTTTTYPFLANSWTMTEDILANPGIEVVGVYAIEVPTGSIPGGQLATQNLTTSNLVYFGEPAV